MSLDIEKNKSKWEETCKHYNLEIHVFDGKGNLIQLKKINKI
jgi:hypothetical protein